MFIRLSRNSKHTKEGMTTARKIKSGFVDLIEVALICMIGLVGLLFILLSDSRDKNLVHIEY